MVEQTPRTCTIKNKTIWKCILVYLLYIVEMFLQLSFIILSDRVLCKYSAEFLITWTRDLDFFCWWFSDADSPGRCSRFEVSFIKLLSCTHQICWHVVGRVTKDNDDRNWYTDRLETSFHSFIPFLNIWRFFFFKHERES